MLIAVGEYECCAECRDYTNIKLTEIKHTPNRSSSI